jgi:sugar phosphate isomerase/epimerase
VAIAIEADRAEACIVADTFHVYRGGSSFKAVRHLDGDLFAVWHYNDAPKEPERFKQRDGDRIYPGDGVLPLPQLLRDLWEQGFRGPLSLEMFNRNEWKKPASEVAKIGMAKMRKTLEASGVGV